MSGILDAEGRQARELISRARGNFVAMAATYALGVFNDNFYKQAMMLIAITYGREKLQGYAALVFTLPFVLFAAPCGWLADRFSKGKVVIGSKFLEFAAMAFGALGVWFVNWPLAFVMLALMALQSTIFGPSLNGSIPELYPAWYVTRANGHMKVFTIAAILAGIACAGLVLDVQGSGPWGLPMGRFLVGVAVIVVALLGVAASFGVPRRPAADPKVKFPWSGPVDSVRILAGLRGDRLLTFSIYGNAYFWFLGVIEVLLINILGKIQFGLSDAVTSYLVGAQLVGVAIGGLTGGWLARGRRWYRIVPPAALATGVLLMAVVSVPYMPVAAQLPALFAFFAGAGLAGGVVLIPLEGFIQARPPADRKGTVFAAANFVAFSAMLASGPLANVLIQNALPTWSLAIMGELTVFASVWFYREVGREDRKC